MSQVNESLKFILKNKLLVERHMERHQETWVQHDNSQLSSTNPNAIQVYIRSRPLLEKDLSGGFYSLLATQPPKHVHLTHPTMRWGGGRFATKTFQADGVFSESATNDEVYEKMGVRSILEECVKFPGSAFSVLAYGQTGCGKTYTTTAIEEFVAQDIFKLTGETNAKVQISIFEIRGNGLYDLLSSPPLQPIKLLPPSLTDAQSSSSLGDLTTHEVHNENELRGFIDTAKGLRLTRSTIKNDTSSRSHCVVIIQVIDEESSKRSQIQIVDLAGSERSADLSRNDPERVKESIETNKSLAALKECIRARIDPTVRHTPWRTTKLTSVLRTSLEDAEKKKEETDGLNRQSKMLVIACVSPSAVDMEDTLSTLKWVMPFQLAVDTKIESDGTDSNLSYPHRWDHEQTVSYIRRNLPKLGPLLPRLFSNHSNGSKLTIIDISRLTLEELTERIKTPTPEESKGDKFQNGNSNSKISPSVVTQCLVLLPSYYNRIQKLVSTEGGKGKGRVQPVLKNKKAENAIHVLSGQDAETAETGLVTRFDMRKGEWTIQMLKPTT